MHIYMFMHVYLQVTQHMLSICLQQFERMLWKSLRHIAECKKKMCRIFPYTIPGQFPSLRESALKQ